MSQLKKNMKRGVLVGALSLTLLTGVAIAKGPGHRGGGSHSPMERIIEKLDLTDEQATEVEKLMAERSAKRDDKRKGMSEIQAMVDQGNIEQAADQAAEQAANSARERVYKMAENQRRLSEILTPEQLAKMEEIKQRMKNRSKRSKKNRESELDG